MHGCRPFNVVYTYLLFGHIRDDSAWCDAVHTNLFTGPLDSETPCELVHPSYIYTRFNTFYLTARQEIYLL